MLAMLETDLTKPKIEGLQKDSEMPEMRTAELVRAEGPDQDGSPEAGLLLRQLSLPTPEGQPAVSSDQPKRTSQSRRARAKASRPVERLSIDLFNQHRANIFAVWHRADRFDRDFGMTAYEKYHEQIMDIGTVNGYGPKIACGVFAGSVFTTLYSILNYHW